MHIITFQHKDIINDLNITGIYKCTRISNFNLTTPNCYVLLADRLGLRGDVTPVFGWASSLFHLDIDLEMDTLFRCWEMTPLDLDNYYLFDLEVPDRCFDLQNFYAFVDERCIEEGIEPDLESQWDVVFNTSLLQIPEIQATMPYIKREWIKGVYRVNTEYITHKTYFKSLTIIDTLESLKESMKIF